MKILGNSIRGITPSQKRILYLTTVLPVLTYGFPIWYRPKARGCRTLYKKLEVIQHAAARWITGGFPTAPSGGLEILGRLAPLDANLDRLYRKAAVRLHITHETSGVKFMGSTPNHWLNPALLVKDGHTYIHRRLKKGRLGPLSSLARTSSSTRPTRRALQDAVPFPPLLLVRPPISTRATNNSTTSGKLARTNFVT